MDSFLGLMIVNYRFLSWFSPKLSIYALSLIAGPFLSKIMDVHHHLDLIECLTDASRWCFKKTVLEDSCR